MPIKKLINVCKEKVYIGTIILIINKRQVIPIKQTQNIVPI